ncbi:ABC transporter ATP-binding protein [Nocardioides humi]|uniref:ABC transporter domain-containing protein n=1 Tax=Nocardioides humi TaxID=449461 RepID=A0ABN2A4K9_9ACTN|nr:ABC transporter ATP-binding protein [Nocardioides humi]
MTSPTLAASARGLTKSYGRGDTLVHALRGVDLDLPAGRFTAIMGPSGSGKSTLMHCLAGLDQPTSGTVSVAGQALEGLGDDALTRFRRDHVGFVFQAFNLLPMLSAEQNIRLPAELAGRDRDPGLRERFDRIVDTLGLTARLTHRPAELSGGQQQRVAIARALLSAPAILFADEPTGNLDSTSSAEVLALLRQSVRELGQTVVMVTHEIEAARYADDVVVLADGRITERREAAAEEVSPLGDACCAPRSAHAGSVDVDRRSTRTPHSAASPAYAPRDARDAVTEGRDL